ncbi:glycosyltransferase family 2 protein [Roseibacterium sp. SDUM158017]|uniref:glycosyltransferase n=1 Tax=Roseicyclus salinarum TaxID=3036773 RepID=UPI002414E51B|nr:glycosyltransferase family 2 protein [Roseibacterium sp. SDUM158017]MDG4648924.1 glycosyltransferase family 2 protein [Roseibacterium sp. SDUM158017]
MIVVELVLVATFLLVALVMVRQLVLTIAFWFTTPRPPVDWVEEDAPRVAILIPAHNEERVIDGCLEAMRRIDYPADRTRIVVINDRSRDATGAIAERHAAEDARIEVIHRTDDMQPGKPAALAGTIAALSDTCDAFIFFDADYVPSPRLVRHLVAPFRDPAVGATMGRVVPYNTDANLLTKLIDLERRGGYVIDQEMRHRLGFLPQFGGTCGAVRASSLAAVGGWNTTVLAEDTDLTYRLFIAGYRVEYLLGAACYEESPEDWRVRFRQVRRWAYGHNDCLFRYFLPVLRASHHSIWARLDAAVVLLFYIVPVLSLVSLVILILSPALGVISAAPLVAVVSFFGYSAIGNFAPYFQIAGGCVHDRQTVAIRSMPLIFLSSFISMFASCSGVMNLLRDRVSGLAPHWDKTSRFRKGGSLPIGSDDG